MSPLLHPRLQLIAGQTGGSLLCGALCGIEKESLRVAANGHVAQTPHPPGLGSALTHPQITTDYSEALLEFITEPYPDSRQVIERLDRIQRYAVSQMAADECLWVNSMPCQVSADEEIPVAEYGSSNIGRMKRIYRLGLGLRYGRRMQAIAGLHFNYSLPDAVWALLRNSECMHCSLQEYKTAGYMALVRNFRRWYWLLIYLMGASPAVCRSFVRDRKHRLEPFDGDEHTLHAPYGTSLRMGDLGYQSSAQEHLYVCYNDLDSYIATLRRALTTEYEPYRQLGEFDRDGERVQLNSHILQIENEFYSPVRPKQTTASGETQLRALGQRGIEYIEVRCLDLNPMVSSGIDLGQMRFVETLLLLCALEQSPETSPEESDRIRRNGQAVVYRGREPGLMLERSAGEVSLRSWADELIAGCRSVADLLDRIHPEGGYAAAVDEMKRRVDDPARTPSAQLLEAIRQSGQSYFGWNMAQSQRLTSELRERALSPDELDAFAHEARDSLQRQQQLESAQGEDLESYIANYAGQYG